MKSLITGVCASIIALGTAPALAQDSAPRVQSEDAHRFAAMFEASGGAPTEADIQTGYLNGAGRGVEIFTRGRIQSAKNLAMAIARHPEHYRRGIEVCLPLADDASTELQQVYAAMQPLFPNHTLPDIHVVFGADNSGGTASGDALVLGLEVICRIAETEEDIRARYRFFFAHEAVHALQDQDWTDTVARDPLLYAVLLEGMADYVSEIVTGRVPNQSRHDWAMARQDQLWAEFAADRRLINAEMDAGATFSNLTEPMREAFARWMWNASSAPEGRPYELGYWMGRQIITDYVQNSEDPDAVLIELLAISDPVSILQASRFYEQAGGDAR